MKAIFATHANKARLQYADMDTPRPGRSSVLIEIHAASLNPHDWKYYGVLSNLYRLPIPLPKLLLGHDVSGVVVDVGKNVTQYQVGDEVYSMSAKTGAFAEYITIDHRMLARKPKNISHLDAATVPMAALTALQAFRISGLEAGKNILIIGGSGGVGVFAIQLAKAKGAHVTTVCSTRNVELVTELGADAVVDYTRDDVTKGTQVFDIIFDTIGNESPASCDAILARDGHFISTNTSPLNILAVFGTRLGNLIGLRKRITSTLLALPRGNDLREIASLIEADKVKPVVDKTFALADMDQAIDYSKSGRTRGKIAISVR